MISIYLCDDELFWIHQLEKAIYNYDLFSDWELEIACKATSPHALLNILRKRQTLNGIYFLDINFESDINGLQLAVEIRKLDPDAIFVFVTTKEEMVMETFRLKLEALDYIIKNHDNWIAEVHSCLAHLEKRFLSRQDTYRETVTFKVGNLYKTFVCKDIYCIDTYESSHRIHIHTTKETVSMFSTLSAIQDRLNDNFQKCSKNCIINLQQVKEIKKPEREIVLHNGMVCACSIREMRRLAKLLTQKEEEE